ncbi:c-type cytochrome [Chelatococcus reniformis]|nr:cytochrome c [Chelatococcus reniformis]
MTMKYAGLVATVLVFAALAVGSTVVTAEPDPIAERKVLLKQMAGAVKDPAQMLKGAEPFNAAKVKEALAVVVTNAGKLPALFPDTSKVGKTDALPKIWESKADFDVRFDKLGKDAAASIASITDEASFKAAMPKVLGNCGACHKEYKKPS